MEIALKPPRREIATGDRTRFAVKIAFLPDPDAGAAATREESLSWAAFQLWAGGHNLCSHIELNEPLDSVHWYMVSVLEWFTSNWDFLFHEEKMPGGTTTRDAWLGFANRELPPANVDEEEWEIKRYNWWSRHCLLSARDGGILPEIFFRRWQDLIEISWGDAPLAGRPEHFSFEATPGYVRLDPSDVASTLYDVLERSAQHLAECAPESERFSQLVKDVQRLRTSDHRRRLGLLAGIDPGSEDDAALRWQDVEGYFPAELPGEIRSAVFGTEDEKLVVRGSCHAALMFGSAAPTITKDDATLLAGKLVAFYSPDGESPRLRQFHRNEPIERSDQLAWRQGYSLAEELLDELGWPLEGNAVDVEKIYDEFGIGIEEIGLQDRAVRAVAIAGPKHKPAVLINENYEATAVEPRRFTLAHELCHILHDRSYGDRLAIMSGPWAPSDVEPRANAFAAMLLMPKPLLDKALRALTVPISTSDGVWEVANRLATSFSATLEHLTNLRFISEVTRDAIRGEVVSRAWPNAPQ
ncbi:MAG TPA: ImmA/IrrE family metallo-endopeptidase [Pirellulales bacterium]|nr:ImmA/IrrE family metallo-endopeptidase [Pirellulales bacterium]